MKRLCMIIIVVNENGGELARWAIEPQYSWAESFSDGVALVQTDEDFWMFVNRANENEFSRTFARIEDYLSVEFFPNKLPVVCETDSSEPYVLKRDGTAAPLPECKIVFRGDGNYTYQEAMSDNYKWGVVDIHNHWLVPPEYTAIAREEEIIHISSFDGDGLVTDDGEVIFFENVRFINQFTNGYALVEGEVPPEETSKDHPTQYWYNYIDAEGNYVLTRPLYEKPAGISNGIITYKENNLYGLMDTNGTVLIPPMYAYAGVYSDGLIAVENENGEIGYVNLNNEIVIPFQKAVYGGEFHNGYAAFETVEGRQYLIDKTGKRVTIDQYTHCLYSAYSENAEGVDVWKLIYSTLPNRIDVFFADRGCIVGPFEFVGQIFPDSFVGTRPNTHKKSLVDISSGEAIWYDFISIGIFSEGLAAVCVDGKWGYVLNPLAAETAG